MFPVGCASGCFQAAIEGERDLVALVQADRRVDDELRPALRPYIIVALLALVDVLKELGGSARKIVDATDREAAPAVKESLRTFHKSLQGGVEASLREIRHTYAAHRTQQTVESLARHGAAMSDDRVLKVTEAARALTDALLCSRLWFWASSRRDGGVVMRRVRFYTAAEITRADADGRLLWWRTTSIGAFTGEDVGEEREFSSLGAATAHANAVWGLSPKALCCCGKKVKPRH